MYTSPTLTSLESLTYTWFFTRRSLGWPYNLLPKSGNLWEWGGKEWLIIPLGQHSKPDVPLWTKLLITPSLTGWFWGQGQQPSQKLPFSIILKSCEQFWKQAQQNSNLEDSQSLWHAIQNSGKSVYMNFPLHTHTAPPKTWKKQESDSGLALGTWQHPPLVEDLSVF